MELFFAGGPNNGIFERFFNLTRKRVNILRNYYELQDRDFKKEILSYKPYVNKIMLDSGAYSAYQSKDANAVEIIKCRYPHFLKLNSDFISENIYRVFTFDYRFDQDGYLDNFLLYSDLRDSYNKTCPVIHRFTESGKNIDLEQYVPYNPPTIAIGQIISRVKKRNKKNNKEDRTSKTNIPKLQRTINSIKDANIDCHLLGITAFGALYNLHSYDTCDSKSWMDYAKSGNVYIFWEPNNTSDKPFSKEYKFPLKLKDAGKNTSFESLNELAQNRFFDEMKRELKLDECDFYNSKSTESLMLANLYYFTKMAEYLNKDVSQSPSSEIIEEKSENIIAISTPENKNPFANAKNNTPQTDIWPQSVNKVTENPF